jgi:integrase
MSQVWSLLSNQRKRGIILPATAPKLYPTPQISNWGWRDMLNSYVQEYRPGRWRLRLPRGLNGLKKRIEIYVGANLKPFYHRNQAEDCLVEILGAMKSEQGRFDPSRYSMRHRDVKSFGTYLTKWLENQERRLEKGQIRPTYLREIRRYVRQYFIPTFGGLDFEQITGLELDTFYLDLDVGPKTTRNILAVLRKIFNDAVRQSVIKATPPFPVTARPPKIKRDWATQEEQERIFENLDIEDLYFVLFQAKHATRTGETRALQHGDINLRTGIITISRAFSGRNNLYPPKTGATRQIPLNGEWGRTYRSRPRNINPQEFVFLRGSKPWSETWASKVWRIAADKAGFPDLSFYHGTRRSWASQKASEGMPLNLIAKMLGDTMTTAEKHYAFVADGENLRRLQEG